MFEWFNRAEADRAARTAKMASERAGVRNKLSSLAPKGKRPERHAASGMTDPRSVGGSGYVPKRMAVVDDRPARVVPRMGRVPR